MTIAIPAVREVKTRMTGRRRLALSESMTCPFLHRGENRRVRGLRAAGVSTQGHVSEPHTVERP